VDKNQSGHIDYHEFITATIDYDKLLNEENLKMAFELFDKNKDGRITADEIKSVLENGNCAFDDKMVAEIIGELDENKDNEVLQ
jgi:calcium-dependent protein kinase